MTCMEAQALITPFINDKLDSTLLERFLDHVEHCKECKEELEVYYALLTALKQLDEEEEMSSDFSKELEHKIKESQETIVRTKLIHIRKRILFFIIVIGIGLLSGISVSVMEEVLNVSKETKMNQVVIKYEVFTPYMEGSLSEHMITYQELQEKIARIEATKKQKEEQEREAARKRLEVKRQRQKETAFANAASAITYRYSKYSEYSKSYEQASDYIKARYRKMKTLENEHNIPIVSDEEYSR